MKHQKQSKFQIWLQVAPSNMLITIMNKLTWLNKAGTVQKNAANISGT